MSAFIVTLHPGVLAFAALLGATLAAIAFVVLMPKKSTASKTIRALLIFVTLTIIGHVAGSYAADVPVFDVEVVNVR